MDALLKKPPFLACQVNKSTSQVELQVLNVKLDELELASLRGDVQEMSVGVNFDSRVGRGKISVAGPRFSGLQGQNLSAALRWERDVLRVERAVLEQNNSR